MEENKIKHLFINNQMNNTIENNNVDNGDNLINNRSLSEIMKILEKDYLNDKEFLNTISKKVLKKYKGTSFNMALDWSDLNKKTPFILDDLKFVKEIDYFTTSYGKDNSNYGKEVLSVMIMTTDRNVLTLFIDEVENMTEGL